MRVRFLHMADVHLGNRQYGLEDRADDFAAAFYHAVDHAIRLRVDFVLIAGDLFHKRQIDAMTLNQAVFGLSRLRDAGIPVIAVQGNHEIAHFEETISWVQFLALQGLIVLLHPNLQADPFRLTAYGANRGCYVDVKPGVRVYGLHFTGAAAGKILGRYAQAIVDLPPEQAAQADGAPVQYRVFLAHAGVQGVLVNDASSPSLSDWHALNDLADYIALGHVHKPFDYEERLYNPGSLETCAVDEVIWDDRGFLVVDVDTTNDPPHRVKRERSQRRPFVRLSVKVDSFPTAEALLDACRRVIADEAERPAASSLRPLVELALTGTLLFAHQALDLEPIQQLAQERLNAFHVLVKNMTSPLVAGASDPGEEMTREELEERIFTDVFGADAGYKAQGELWARGTREVKKLALQEAAPSLIVSQVDATLDDVARATHLGPAAPDFLHAIVVEDGGPSPANGGPSPADDSPAPADDAPVFLD